MKDVEREFQKIADKVAKRGEHELTARGLLHAVGARRRGANIVAEIRSRLARHHLETQPDFAEVWPDESIKVVLVKNDQPPYVARLTEAVKQLEEHPDKPRSIKGREMLAWFDAEHRSAAVSEQIKATLAGFDLETDPDFESVHVDEPLLLVRRNRAAAPPPSDEPSVASPEPETKASIERKPPKSRSTFHVGTLDEARREWNSPELVDSALMPQSRLPFVDVAPRTRPG